MSNKVTAALLATASVVSLLNGCSQAGQGRLGTDLELIGSFKSECIEDGAAFVRAHRFFSSAVNDVQSGEVRYELRSYADANCVGNASLQGSQRGSYVLSGERVSTPSGLEAHAIDIHFDGNVIRDIYAFSGDGHLLFGDRGARAVGDRPTELDFEQPYVRDGSEQDANPLAATVRVEFDRPLTDAARLTGFLHALGETAPGDDLITPLAPATWRGAWRADSPQYERIRGFGADYLFVLSDRWGYPTGPLWGGRGAPYNDFEAWEAFVREEVEQWRGFPVTIDIWNEPDVLGVFWFGTLAQFVETWVRAAAIVTEILGPEAKIAGPSAGAYDPIYISALIEGCANYEGCRLTTLEWHELIGPIDMIAWHLEDARTRYLESDDGRAIGLERIVIAEYVGAGRQYSPGIHLGALAQLQAGGADGAALACWALVQIEEEENECYGPILDGLLTPIDHKPRAPWWVHERYAAGADHAVTVTADALQVAGLATADDGNGRIQVLVGRYDTADPFPGFSSPILSPEPIFVPSAPPVRDIVVELVGLDSSGVPDGFETVIIERLPYNGRAPLLHPMPVDVVTVNVIDGNARVALAAVPTHDVLVLSLQAKTPASASLGSRN